MLSAQRLDDNPCRPRHFKPPPCAPVVADPVVAQLLESTRTRLLLALSCFALIFLVVVGRMVDVVELGGDRLDPHAARARLVAPPPPLRADIVDRNGTLLATNLDSPALYVDSKEMLQSGENPDEAAQRIAKAMPNLSLGEIRGKLASGRSFTYLKRSLTPDQEFAVNNLGIPGIEFSAAERRIYPLGDLVAHTVGYCNIDNIGEAGIERGLNKTIRGATEPVALSIDARVQFVLKDELQHVVDQFGARGAAGIIMNVNTGEIVAMASLPDFDPNHPPTTNPKRETDDDKARIFNKITSGEYELGSVFKIFNTAMALDSGVSTMSSVYDARNDIQVDRFTISDYHGKHSWLSVPEIFAYSSNIGSARMAMAAGGERQRTFLSRLGLLSPVPTIQFSPEEVGRPHFPSVWRPINVMTIAFGHGIAVTPLHMITATAAMVNGGILRPPTMLKVPEGEQVPGVRVISPKTSEQMRKLFRLVVEDGTAKQAEAQGYVVGGKTGTAEKNEHGHYEEKKLVSSFMGAFPINNPQYAIFTLVDEPHGNKESHGYATAGWTVVPATSRIIERIAPLLGVAPQDENAPEIKNALQIESLVGKKLEYH
ncbi:MAG TPA: penicillin-binding protein 2 [Stellaceae bacterium]|jgi:cell division protein FtsI (penicillin-binding protein 3)|nr:penicillin-binding protein 2 [Stellaceae bacterium]